MVPGAVRGARQAPGDGRHLDARAAAARRRASPSRRGSSRCSSAGGAGEVPISISGDPATAGTLVHTVRAVGLATEAICAGEPGDVLGVRGPFGVPWPVGEPRGRRRRSSSPAASAWRRCARRSSPCSPSRERYGRLLLLYGGRVARPAAVHRRARGVARPVDSRWPSPSTAPGPEWLGHVGVVTRLVDRAELDPAATVALLCGPEVMMRFTVAALQRAGSRRRAHPRLDGAQHAVRHRPLRPLPARADARLPRRPGLRVERARAAGSRSGSCDGRRSRRSPCGSSPRATAASSACSTARTSC